MKKIFVKIDEENIEKVKDRPGFMSRDHYPDFHEKDSHPDEIGSFLDFRFIKDM